jgi:nickel-dependent lactate racemase
MTSIALKYGRTAISLEFDASRFNVLGSVSYAHPLSDVDIDRALDVPIDSPPLEEIVAPGERVLVVVPDATRQTGCGQVVNLLVRRLIANGTSPGDINVIFATGIHRQVTHSEKEELLTAFIVQRIRTLDHDASDPLKNFRLGETLGGIPVELNWVLTEFDHIVLIGGVTFHYFAGFTGGRKLLCPGLASARSIEATHKLAFDCETRSRREGVGTALLDGNAVHEAFVDSAARVEPAFAINTIVNDAGEITDLFCGHWITSHRRACEEYSSRFTLKINEPRDLVVANCGGYPLDIDLIQAHKALEAASYACRDGGTLLLFAECADGLGRADFLKWFESKDSYALAEHLCENYEVNGQTAWSLMSIAEHINVRVVTSLPDDAIKKLRLHKTEPNEVQKHIKRAASGYILPFGAKFRIIC